MSIYRREYNCVLMALLLVFACTGAGELMFRGAEAGSLERIEFLEDRMVHGFTSIGIEELGNTRSLEERAFLDEIIRNTLLSVLPSDFEENPDRYILAGEDREVQEYLAEIGALLNQDNTRGSDVPWFLRKLSEWRVIRSSATIFRLYHSAIIRMKRSSWNQLLDTPAYLKDDFELLSSLDFIHSEKAVNPGDAPEVAFNVLRTIRNREYGVLSVPVDVPASTHVNSRLLARALNQLANADTETHNYSPFDLESERGTLNIRDHRSFVDAIEAHPDYELVLYEARNGNDFMNMYVKDRGIYSSVELPSFIRTRVGRRAVYFPATHGEFVLAVYRPDDHVPVAMAKWYKGLPSDPHLHQGTIWQASTFSYPAWRGYKITSVHKDSEDIVRFLEGATGLMKLYNYVQGEYDFPSRGYGVIAVCNDTASIMRAILGNNPDTGLFPNLRATAFDGLYARFLSPYSARTIVGDDGLLTVPSDPYFSTYSDQIREAGAERLSLNFPFRSRESIQGETFRKVYDELSRIIPDFDQRIR